MAAKIRKGDKVVVLTGRDKGKHRRSARGASRRRTARWCAASTWSSAIRSRRRSQEGGIVTKEAPIHLSNLALADPKDGKPTRVGFKTAGRRQEGALRQALRRCDRWLTKKTRRPKAQEAQGDKARAREGRARREGEGRSCREGRGAKGDARARAEGLRAAPAEAVRRGRAPEADRAVRLQERACRCRRSTRSCSTWASARPCNDRKKVEIAAADLALIAGQKAVITKRASRSRPSRCARTCRSAARSRCARRACTSSSTGWSPSRCRACATSAASIRRASTAAATTRIGIKEHIIFPEIDYDKIDRSGAWTSSSARRRRPTTKRARCSRLSTSRSGSERAQAAQTRKAEET